MTRRLIGMLLLCCMTLVGCATNTQNENTAAGALTGAVIGGFAGNAVGKDRQHGRDIAIGTVAGAIIGAIIGHYIDSTDHNTTYPFLSHNPMTNPSTWEDPQTHITYSLKPTSNLYAIHGNPNCRHFHFSSTSYKKMHAFDGTACYLPNGHWERIH